MEESHSLRYLKTKSLHFYLRALLNTVSCEEKALGKQSIVIVISTLKMPDLRIYIHIVNPSSISLNEQRQACHDFALWEKSFPLHRQMYHTLKG